MAPHGEGDTHGGGDPHGAGEQAPPEQLRGARLTRLSGRVQIGERTAAAGERLSPGEVITTGPGATVVLDLPDRARFELEGDSVATLADEAPAQLVLGRGTARGMLPPEGGSIRPPLRLAGPTVTAEIGGSGDAWLTVLPSGSGWVASLGGRIGVRASAVGEDRALLETILGPGQGVAVSGAEAAGSGTAGSGTGATGIAEPIQGPQNLAAAREASRQLLAGAEAPVEGARAASLDAALRLLTESLGWLEEERRAGAALSDQHRAAVEGDPARARALLVEIAAHSQRRLRLQEVVLSRWERVLGWALLGGSAGRDPDPVALHRPRVRALLGLD